MSLTNTNQAFANFHAPHYDNPNLFHITKTPQLLLPPPQVHGDAEAEGHRYMAKYRRLRTEQKHYKHTGLRSDSDFGDQSNNAIEHSKEEEEVPITLRTAAALMGLSGLALPLMAFVSIPFDLLNPNLFFAKALTLLTIPVAILTYGKSFPTNSWLDFIDNISSNKSANDPSKWKTKSRAFFIIKPGKYDFDVTTDSAENSTVITSSSSLNKPQQREQCLERIACEGLIKSIPQLFLKTLLRGQESMLREIGVVDYSHLFKDAMGSKTTPTTATTTPSLASILLDTIKPNFTARRKDLAKLALKRIQNTRHHFLKQGSTNHSSKVGGSSGFTSSQSQTTSISPSDSLCLRYHCSLMI